MKCLKLRSCMFKLEYFYIFSPRYFGRSKLYFLSSDTKKKKKKKLNFWGAIVGMKAQICILGLKPYLIMWICSRRSKRLDRPQNGGSHTEKGRRVSSEEVILLGWGERQSSKYLGNLGDLLGISNDKDELQARTKRISIQLREKLLPPHSMHCSNFFGRIYVEKTPKQCSLNHYHS